MEFFKSIISSTLLLIILAIFFPRASVAAIVTEEVTYKVGELNMNGLLAYNTEAEGERPGVLVVHEWWGMNEYAQNRAKELAKLGYVALAIDMYGDGKTAGHPKDAGAFSKAVMKDIENARARFEAGLALLKARPRVDADKVAAIGYCFGGGIVLNMARMGVELDGVVSFHGMLKPAVQAKPGEVKASVMVAHGAEDSFVPAEDVEAFKKEMTDAGVDLTFHTYEGAKHSFTNPEADEAAKKFEIPVAYDKAADEKSWQDMQQFFARVIK